MILMKLLIKICIILIFISQSTYGEEQIIPLVGKFIVFSPMESKLHNEIMIDHENHIILIEKSLGKVFSCSGKISYEGPTILKSDLTCDNGLEVEYHIYLKGIDTTKKIFETYIYSSLLKRIGIPDGKIKSSFIQQK